jgi:Protein of unknown function (DUF2948)
MSDGLRLKAEDGPGVEVLSAALQDSVLRAGDLAYDARARRFTALVNRFRWEKANARGPFERVRSALAVESVTAVKATRVSRTDKNAIASVLSLAFEPDAEPPGGSLSIVLAGGGEIRLALECVDVLLLDMGAPWPTPRRPRHEGVS